MTKFCSRDHSSHQFEKPPQSNKSNPAERAGGLQIIRRFYEFFLSKPELFIKSYFSRTCQSLPILLVHDFITLPAARIHHLGRTCKKMEKKA